MQFESTRRPKVDCKLPLRFIHSSLTDIFCMSKSLRDLTILLRQSTPPHIRQFLSITIHSLLQKVDPELIVVNDFIGKTTFYIDNNCHSPQEQTNAEAELDLPTTRQSPSIGEPVAHVIIDEQTHQLSYIGFARNLESRFRTHTQGHDKRTPRRLVFFVTGFPYKTWIKKLLHMMGHKPCN